MQLTANRERLARSLSISKAVLLLVGLFFFLSQAAMAGMGHGHAKMGKMDDSDKHMSHGAHHMDMSGKWMFMLRSNYMRMSGNRDGSSSVSRQEVLFPAGGGGFLAVPTNMYMSMNMFGAMYHVNHDWSVMAMLPYVRKSMRIQPRMGPKFTTRSEGLGDIKLMSMYKFWRHEAAGVKRSMTLHAGISLPTGSTTVKDSVPMPGMMGVTRRVRLPYPMQIGSGSYDPMLGISYKAMHHSGWAYGSKLMTTQRIENNSRGYRLGDEYMLDAWVKRSLSDQLAVSFKLNGKSWRDIKGEDEQIETFLNMPMAPGVQTIPTARTDLRSGSRVDAGFSVNWSPIMHNHFSLHFSAPVYQHLDGPQMEVDYQVGIAWRGML